MSRQSKGARLWLEPARYTADGKIYQHAAWIIRDGARKISTGCLRDDSAQAERKLAEYIASKYRVPRERDRYPAEILVLDVLNIYLVDKAPKHARPEETKQRVLTLADFWQHHTLADVTGPRCREYVFWRTKQIRRACRPDQTNNPALMVKEGAARRELEDLRAAINHHRQEGLCSEIVSVTLPKRSPGRNACLTRSQAARLVWAAWRARQVMRDGITKREVGKHIARFLLIGVYTGTRHAAICSAALQPAVGRGYVDLARGVFHRRAQGAKETNKRQPPVRLPDRLLAHLRRWQRLAIATHAVIEWNGKPVRSVRKGFAATVKAAGFPTTGPEKITPHVLRHTAATWAMQNGADLWQAAGFLGMTVEMLQERYGHHHPDFQAGAAHAVSMSPRQNPDRLTVNKTRQTPTIVHKNR
jgi:integrase